jgi:hypothetical protein
MMEEEILEEDKKIHFETTVFIQKSFNNTNRLWKHLHEIQNFPEYYFGIVESMALCKCPLSGNDEWFRAEFLGNNKTIRTGTEIEINRTFKNEIHSKKTVFVRWELQPFHEWKLQNGCLLQMRQDFVDGLTREDRRYLKIKS